jgi:hypothetical protein
MDDPAEGETVILANGVRAVVMGKSSWSMPGRPFFVVAYFDGQYRSKTFEFFKL